MAGRGQAGRGRVRRGEARQGKILRSSPQMVDEARERVLEFARKHGAVTTTQASRIGRWKQPWHYLNRMVESGVLRHVGYGQWEPAAISSVKRHRLQRAGYR